MLFMRAAFLFACLLPAGLALATPEKAARFYEDALTRYDKGDFAAAIVQLKNAIQQDRGLLPAHLLMGKALLRKGELKGAEAAFEESLKLGVNRAEVALPLGQVYLLQGEPKLVLERIQPAGLPLAAQVEVLTLRGTAYADMGNFAMATRTFAEARALAPNSVTPLVAEIPLLLRGNDLERARAFASKSVEIAPKDASAWSAHASVMQAVQDEKTALASYNQALVIDPALAEARVARASLFLKLGREKEAESDLVYLKSNRLDDARAAYLRALIAHQKGNSEAAKAELREVVRLVDGLPPSWVAGREHYLMAGALGHYSLRNWQKARDYLQIIVGRSTRNLIARKLLASTYVEAREYDKAQPALEALMKEVPNDIQVNYLLGTVYLAQRRFVQASELLERATSAGGGSAATRELGIAQIALSRDAQGLANLEKAFADDPSDTRAATELAMTYARSGQKQKAVQICEGVVKRDPSNLAMLNFMGTIKSAIGDSKGARLAYESALARDLSFRPSALNLARLDVKESRFDAALARLTQLLARTGDDSDVLFELGVIERAAKRPAQAIRQWQRADDIQRVDPRPGLALVELHVEQQQVPRAIEIAKALASKYPDNLAVQIILGQALLAGGNQADARQIFQVATRISGFDPDIQLRIGRLQLQAANPDGAVYNAQKALQARGDDALALALLVEAETRRGDSARADAALKILNAKHAGSNVTLLTGANLAMARGQYAAAAAGYRAVASREPTTAIAINVAHAHIAAGESVKAVAYLQQWLKARPQDQSARKALAEAQSKVGDYPGARQTYSVILSAEPEDPLTLNNMAVVLLRLGDSAQAGVLAAKAYKITPAVPEIADTLGWSLARQGKDEEALRYLREARLRSPTNGEIRFHLATVLFRLGRTGEAREELAAAMNSPRKANYGEELARLKAQIDP